MKSDEEVADLLLGMIDAGTFKFGPYTEQVRNILIEWQASKVIPLSDRKEFVTLYADLTPRERLALGVLKTGGETVSFDAFHHMWPCNVDDEAVVKVLKSLRKKMIPHGYNFVISQANRVVAWR